MTDSRKRKLESMCPATNSGGGAVTTPRESVASKVGVYLVLNFVQWTTTTKKNQRYHETKREREKERDKERERERKRERVMRESYERERRKEKRESAL